MNYTRWSSAIAILRHRMQREVAERREAIVRARARRAVFGRLAAAIQRAVEAGRLGGAGSTAGDAPRSAEEGKTSAP